MKDIIGKITSREKTLTPSETQFGLAHFAIKETLRRLQEGYSKATKEEKKKIKEQYSKMKSSLNKMKRARLFKFMAPPTAKNANGWVPSTKKLGEL